MSRTLHKQDYDLVWNTFKLRHMKRPSLTQGSSLYVFWALFLLPPQQQLSLSPPVPRHFTRTSHTDHDLNMTMSQFKNKYGENMKRDDLSIEGSEIYVFFPDEPKIGVKMIKNYIKRLVQDDTDKAIVLIQQNLTPFAKRFISEMRSKYYLEVFQVTWSTFFGLFYPAHPAWTRLCCSAAAAVTCVSSSLPAPLPAQPGNMVLTEEEIMRLYRVRKTVMQMLKDRDYLIVDHDLNMTMSQFKNKHEENMKREDLTINRRKRDDESDQINVFFPDEPKIGAKTMKSYITRMNQENVIRAILVVQQNLTPFAKTSISEMGSKFHLEIFQEAELLMNIKEHVLVPEYRFLTNEENKTCWRGTL